MKVNPDWAVCYRKAIADDGTLLFPERLTHDFLAAARRTMGVYLFGNQYQNETVPDGMQTFKKHWRRYYAELPTNIMTFAFVDPAISEADTADYTGIVVVSTDIHQNWYLRSAIRKRMNPTELINMLFKISETYKTHMIGVETVAFQKAILHFAHEEMKRRNKHIAVTGVNLGTDRTKEMRILSLVPRFEMGTIMLAQGLSDFEREYDTFPRGAHDDLCFVAGTIVATTRGNKPIENIAVGDKVITPNGPDEVTHISNSYNYVISNLGLTGTAEHPIWTWRGKASFIDVSASSKLSFLSCSELIRHAVLSSWISTEFPSAEWAARENITCLLSQLTMSDEQKPSGFTSLFTSFIQKRRYRRAITFTIKTVIHSIIGLRTLSAFHLVNTRNTLAVILSRCAEILNGFDRKHLSGTRAQRGAHGTESTLAMYGKRLSRLNLNVFNVFDPLSHRFATPCIALNYADQDTAPQNTLVMSKKNVSGADRSSNLKINHYENIALSRAAIPVNRQVVYNLRTKKHGYYYANGILVSNCDALASIESIVTYPIERKVTREPTPNDPDYEKWYIANKLGRTNY